MSTSSLMTDPRFRDSKYDSNSPEERLRPGVHLLRKPNLLASFRAGQYDRIPADNSWREMGATCECGRPVEWNMPGLDWPICDPCFTDALDCLAILEEISKAEVASKAEVVA